MRPEQRGVKLKAGHLQQSNPVGVQLKHSANSAPHVQYIYVEDSEGCWLSSCPSSVAEHWQLKPGVLGLIPSNYWSFLILFTGIQLILYLYSYTYCIVWHSYFQQHIYLSSLLFPWLQALPSLQHSLELHEAHFDPDGPEVATAMCELATLYTHTGKVKLVSNNIYL